MDEKAARQEMEALMAKMVETWNRHDLEGYTEAWVDDLDFVNVVGFYRKGKAALRAELEFLHAGRFRDSQISVLKNQIRFLTPEHAVVHVWWEMTGDPGMPGMPVDDGKRRGIFTHVAQLTPQGWRWSASQNTDCLPIPDPLAGKF